MAASITVVCPNAKCRRQMRASTDHVGRKARCPYCKTRFEIRPGQDSESLGTLVLSKDAESSPSRNRRARSTDASPWLSGIIGLVAAGIVYAIVLIPLKGTYVGTLFVHGGAVSVANTIITCWGLAALALKYLAVKRQLSYAELELDLIPLEIGLEITAANVNQFLDHLSGLPDAQWSSILGRRIQGALEHFKSRNSVPEVQQYLSTQAEIDASSVDSGYTMLRTFIWANPILGFIGTVVGISFAVTGLSTTFAAGGGTENLMNGLGQVTAGLSTAFDTTLIGLLFAMLLMFPTESLRKTEYGMLDRIEAFTNESLLRRMSDERSAGTRETPTIVRDALEAAFHEHQRWLAQWQAQVGELGQIIGGDFEQAATRIEAKLSQANSERSEQLLGLTAVVDQLFEEIRQSVELFNRSRRDALEVTESLSKVVQNAKRDDSLLADAIGDAAGRPVSTGEPTIMPEMSLVLQDLQHQVGRLIDRLDSLIIRCADNAPLVASCDGSSAANPEDVALYKSAPLPLLDTPGHVLRRTGFLFRLFGSRDK